MGIPFQERIKRITDEYAATPTPTEQVSVSKMARLTPLFIEGAKARTRKELVQNADLLFRAMLDIGSRVRPDVDFGRFLAEAHGVSESMLMPTLRRLPSNKIRQVLFYNAFHWSGVSDLLGAESQFKNFRTTFKGLKIEGTPDGKLRVTPELLSELVIHTPHFVKVGLNKFVSPEVKGEADLTPGQLFVLLRAASNSLHSIKMNRILYNFREALDDPEKLKRAVNRASSKKHAANVGAENMANYFAGMDKKRERQHLLEHLNTLAPEALESEFQSSGVIRPSRKESVLADLKKRQVLGAEHAYALAAACKFPLSVSAWVNSFLNEGMPITELNAGIQAATKNNRLKIELTANGAVVRDTGLGKLYENFSKYRPGKGTSKFLQDKAARINHEFNDDETVTRLEFK